MNHIIKLLVVFFVISNSYGQLEVKAFLYEDGIFDGVDLDAGLHREWIMDQDDILSKLEEEAYNIILTLEENEKVITFSTTTMVREGEEPDVYKCEFWNYNSEKKSFFVGSTSSGVAFHLDFEEYYVTLYLIAAEEYKRFHITHVNLLE